MFKIVQNIIPLILFVSFSLNTLSAQNKTIDTDKSTIIWKGHKITGSHDGTINFESGQLLYKNDELVGGEFIIDMTSINVTDLDGKSKGKLEGHLKSEDFFGVETHPKSKLVFTKVTKTDNGYEVIGDFTLKNITEPITFNLTVAEDSISSELSIDRTKYDVRYGSKSFFNNLKNSAINDEFDLYVTLFLNSF
ncbi:YceI family protein [Winogradskyella maritima]|uniref:YceI family protein n=1 Tax=Winogradskyella maritima TaxID=1517766 RepID=A0ABV8AGZ5_9FLAO|nr:YceI family protein [Winogradskyella maritima]